MDKSRIVWIDVLNIVACAGVLLLHCTNREVHHFMGIPSVNWFIGLFTHSFVLWPVNIFFMISGFTLMRKSLISISNPLVWGGGGGGKKKIKKKGGRGWESFLLIEFFFFFSFFFFFYNFDIILFFLFMRGGGGGGGGGGVKSFYIKRWQRLGMPLIIWNFFYMCLHILTLHMKGDPLETAFMSVQKFVLFEYNGFMWFFVPLIL